MKLRILALGTRGDVQPCVALGRGLAAAGHDVAIAAFEDFRELVTSHGLAYRAIQGRMVDLIQTEASREIARSGGNLLKSTRLMSEILDSFTGRFCENLLQACEGAEAVLFSTAAPHGYHLYAIPEALGIPAFGAYLFPMFGYDRVFSHPLWPDRVDHGAGHRWLTHRVTEQLIWQPFRRTINGWRRRVLKLPPVPFWGPYRTLAQRPILYGYSPEIIPPPPDVSWAHVTGFWFLDRDPAWQPSGALVRFIDAGRPPVYIGFGSINFAESEDAMTVMRQAVKAAGQRAVVLGTPAIPEGPLDDDLFVIHSIPFDWLFPRMAAVVHHGGAGTTALGLRAGVPSVVIPFKGEQLYFGHRVAELGAAVAPLDRRTLTVEALRHALVQAVSDRTLKERAQKLSQAIQAEDGVGRAVAVFHRLIESKR